MILADTRRRKYTAESGFGRDFHRVREFLVRINRTNPIAYDFEWGRWEWAFSLPYLDESSLSRIGVWERNGTIVGLATYETSPGTVYFCLDPAYTHLQEEMLRYAMDALRDANGSLKVLINNTDTTLQRLAARHGFTPTQETEGNSVYDIEMQADGAVESALPPGFTLASLAEACDLYKLNRVLWRGFNHPGEPPETDEQIEMRRKSISGPHLQRELNIVAIAPNGDYASYCGMWYDAHTEYALVEPLATAPAYRRLGLGRAVVLEGIRRCARLGATQAYVGSAQQFYYQIGFRPLPAGTFWQRISA